jgi:hypothetical protein
MYPPEDLRGPTDSRPACPKSHVLRLIPRARRPSELSMADVSSRELGGRPNSAWPTSHPASSSPVRTEHVQRPIQPLTTFGRRSRRGPGLPPHTAWSPPLFVPPERFPPEATSGACQGRFVREKPSQEAENPPVILRCIFGIPQSGGGCHGVLRPSRIFRAPGAGRCRRRTGVRVHGRRRGGA